jgi:hypothetical protein
MITIKKLLDWQKKEIPEDQIELEVLRHFLSAKDLQQPERSLTKVQELVEFLSKPTHELIPMFKWKGVEYGFIPNLSEDLTLGEFIDLNTFSKDPETTIQWLSVLYRPITFRKGNLYDIEEYSGKKYDFEDLDASVLLGAQFFFLQLATHYLKSLEHYLKEEEMVRMN